MAPAAGLDPELDQLSPREREVLRLIARGYTYKEVGRGPEHLGQDGRIARLVGPAQVAAVDSPRADEVGHRQALGLDRGASCPRTWPPSTATRPCWPDMAGRALVELRADPPALRDIGAAGDRMAHQLLVGELNRLYPDDDVRSEEGLEHVAGDGRLWIVDPLDGTREFRQLGRTDWAVHVALAVGGVAVVGAVALPALDIVLSTADPPDLLPSLPASPRASSCRGAGLPTSPTTSPRRSAA